MAVEECTAIRRQTERIVQEESDSFRREFNGAEIVSMNCWGFLPGIFPLLDRKLRSFLAQHGADIRAEFQLPTAVADMIAANALSVQVLRTDSPWFGVTYRDDLPVVVSDLRRMIDSGHYPRELWA